jgi:hypothetical protein
MVQNITDFLLFMIKFILKSEWKMTYVKWTKRLFRILNSYTIRGKDSNTLLEIPYSMLRETSGGVLDNINYKLTGAS